MSRNGSTQAQKHEEPQKKPRKSKPDARVQRTRDQLGRALIELIVEKPINDVTVQDVLERAGVGRSTFYLHFRDKGDLLMSQLEMFLEFMSTMLSARQEKSLRVAPVAEMFEHIGNQNKLYRVLSDSGQLKDFFELAEGYFTRGIERRLAESGRLAKVPQRELAARASALAGSLLSLLRWWLDRGEKETPQAMDAMFHRMVWGGVG
ncbi:MAG TPA: helix-turn-helix domain-containing protein [Terracidiphilus sp.]|jgi:AcrR family transcriptional regulator|nr:helix-turn-helix domain-containing protein [Terracidiphilus sp.]